MSFLQPFTTLSKHKNVDYSLDNRPTAEEYLTAGGIAEGFGQADVSAFSDKGSQDPENPAKDENLTALDRMRNAMRSQKIGKKGLNALLIEDPERPELDEEWIGRNKNMAKAAAILQVIDSLGSAVGQIADPNEPVFTPTSFQNMGLTGLQNIADEQQEYDLSLQRFNERRDQVSRANAGIRQDVNMHNAEVDTMLAQLELDEEQRQRIEEDNTARWYLESGNRLLSQGAIDEGLAMLEKSGLEIPGNLQNLRDQAGDGGEKPLNLEEYGLNRGDLMAYNAYQQLQSQVTDDMYTEQLDENGATVMAPKPGTPAARLARLEEELGMKLFVMQGIPEINPKPESNMGEMASQERRRPAPEGQGVLQRKFQEYQSPAEREKSIGVLRELGGQIRSGEASENDITEWEIEYRRMAYNNGITDPDEIQENLERDLAFLMGEEPSEQYDSPENVPDAQREQPAPVNSAGGATPQEQTQPVSQAERQPQGPYDYSNEALNPPISAVASDLWDKIVQFSKYRQNQLPKRPQ